MEEEYKKPNSQKRVAEGKIPHMWGQSMYILGRLMIEVCSFLLMITEIYMGIKDTVYVQN